MRNLLTSNYVNWCKISQCENVAIILTYNPAYDSLCVFNISYFFLLSSLFLPLSACCFLLLLLLFHFFNFISFCHKTLQKFKIYCSQEAYLPVFSHRFYFLQFMNIITVYLCFLLHVIQVSVNEKLMPRWERDMKRFCCWKINLDHDDGNVMSKEIFLLKLFYYKSEEFFDFIVDHHFLDFHLNFWCSVKFIKKV